MNYRPLQLLLLAGTLLLALLLSWQGAPLTSVAESPAGIVSLQWARTAQQATAIRNAWGTVPEAPLMQVALQNIRLDFAYILFYVLLLYTAVMAGSQQLPTALRRWVPYMGILTLKAGLMDVIENGMLLYQLQHRITQLTAAVTYTAAILKFLLLVIVATWILMNTLLRLFAAGRYRTK